MSVISGLHVTHNNLAPNDLSVRSHTYFCKPGWLSIFVAGPWGVVQERFGLFVRGKQSFESCAQDFVLAAFALKEGGAFLHRLGRGQNEQRLFALVRRVHEWFGVARLILHAQTVGKKYVIFRHIFSYRLCAFKDQVYERT